MKITVTANFSINEMMGVHDVEKLPTIATLPNGSTIQLLNEGEYMPKDFFDNQPSSSGYWDYGQGFKLRYSEDGISSGGQYYDRRGWRKIEVLCPHGTVLS